MLRKATRVLLAALPLLLIACDGGDDNIDRGGRIGGGGGGGGTGGDACTVEEQNAAVYQLMTDVYYWYQHVPEVDPSDYSSPEALLQAVRYTERDQTFSYLTTVEEEEAFLNNAAYVGFGFSSVMNGARLFLRESFEGGPAHEAGMRRGDEIVAIDGVTVTSMSPTQINNAFGPNEEGYEVTFDIRHADGSEETVTVAKTEVNSPVVGTVQTDLGADENATYVFFRSFVNPAFDQLDDAFAAMKDAGDNQLILDMRYNGGGLLSVAQHLGSLVAGNTHPGTVVAEIEFNDRYQGLNEQYILEELVNSADITDLVVITTGATASASEMIINGLEPHMNVTVVGDNTFGKPVGQSRLEFCETEILRAVTFKVVNSEGEGEYFPPTGIAPDCAATDDISHQLGEEAEASVAEALHYLDEGQCNADASAKAAMELARQKALSPQGDPLVRDGWDVLTGGAR